MALIPTLKLRRNPRSSRRPGHGATIAVWLLILGFGALAWYWRPITRHAVAATSYAARTACSCRFVAGRPLGQCRRDLAPGTGPLWLSEDEARHSVTARFPPFSSQTATWHQGSGCVLEPWGG